MKTLKCHIWNANSKINAINVIDEVRNNMVEMRFCFKLINKIKIITLQIYCKTSVQLHNKLLENILWKLWKMITYVQNEVLNYKHHHDKNNNNDIE